MSKPGHDIVVKVGLTADQYLELVRLAEDADVSQSSFVRSLIVAAIRSDAINRMRQGAAHASALAGQD